MAMKTLALVAFLTLTLFLTVFAQETCVYNNIIVNNGHRIPDICAEIYCLNGNFIETGSLSSDCTRCEVYNDPHFHSYTGCNFDYHGKCNYSVSQKGNTYEPEYGVFAQFVKCPPPHDKPPTRTCIEYTTMRDDDTVINIGQRGGLNHPQIYDIEVNGCDFTVLSEHPEWITCNGVHYPMLAWRYFDKDPFHHSIKGYRFYSIRILSSHFLVQQSNNSINIWVNKDLQDLQGMCRATTYSKYSGKLFARDGTSYWQNCNFAYPASVIWGESWKTHEQGNPECDVYSSRRKRRKVEMVQILSCSNATFDVHHDSCHGHLNQVSTRSFKNKHFVRRKGACATDLCGIEHDEGHELWLYQVGGMFAEMDHIISKTVDIHSGSTAIAKPICSKNNGTCTLGECGLEERKIVNGCKINDINCCAPKCFRTEERKCKQVNGYCQSEECISNQRDIPGGCGPDGCHCCAPKCHITDLCVDNGGKCVNGKKKCKGGRTIKGGCFGKKCTCCVQAQSSDDKKYSRRMRTWRKPSTQNRKKSTNFRP